MRLRDCALAALSFVLGACSSDDKARTVPTPPVTAAATAQTAIGIANFKFTPPDVKVPVGGSVVWTNNDNQPHTATSSGSFDAGAIQPGASATVAFETAGTFTYICSFHPFMNGTVTVG